MKKGVKILMFNHPGKKLGLSSCFVPFIKLYMYISGAIIMKCVKYDV